MHERKQHRAYCGNNCPTVGCKHGTKRFASRHLSQKSAGRIAHYHNRQYYLVRGNSENECRENHSVKSHKLPERIKKLAECGKSTRIGKYVYQQYKNGHVFDEKIESLCSDIDAAYTDIANLEAERESVGIDDHDIEVVEAELDDDDDIDISPEDEEILKDL